MMRRTGSVILLLAAALVVACDLGTAAVRTDGGGGGGGGDGGSADASTAAAAHNHCLTAGAAECLNSSNPSNAGADCGQAGCHVSGGSGGTFQFMGTMCATTPCAAPAQGVTVMFGGVTATTDQAGNFYVGAGETPLTGSSTNTQGGFMMGAGSSPAPAADCNQSACHQATSTQTFPVGGTGVGGNGSIYN
jgi:hypothetical protein